MTNIQSTMPIDQIYPRNIHAPLRSPFFPSIRKYYLPWRDYVAQLVFLPCQVNVQNGTEWNASYGNYVAVYASGRIRIGNAGRTDAWSKET